MDTPAVEWLKFQVPPSEQAHFIEQDEQIWTPLLSRSPGFLKKEFWTDPNDPTAVIIVIHWASRAQWKAIPQTLVEQTTQQFNQAVGADYPLVEAREYRPVTSALEIEVTS